MQEGGERSLRLPWAGRAGARELGEVLGAVLSHRAPAQLRGGFREAVCSREVWSAEPGASAAWDERVLRPASLAAPSPGAEQRGRSSAVGSRTASQPGASSLTEPLQRVVTVSVKITNLSKYLLLYHVLRSGCRAFRNGKPPPGSCQS